MLIILTYSMIKWSNNQTKRHSCGPVLDAGCWLVLEGHSTTGHEAMSVVLCTPKCPCAARVWKLDLAATQNRRIIPLPSLLCLSPLPRLMDALNSSKRMLRRPITISDQQWPDQWPHTVSDTCSTCHQSSPLPPWTQALASSRSLLSGWHSKDECPKLIHSDLLINLR